MDGGAFQSCSNLTTINLPETITTIGGAAFWECYSLVIDDLSLPNLTTLMDCAFRSTKIKKVSNLGNIT